MYVRLPFSSSIIFLFKVTERFPVFLVNCFSPLGHSGQPKLQEVVGSILNANGSPEMKDFLKNLETIKLRYSLITFTAFLTEKNFIKAINSDLCICFF